MSRLHRNARSGADRASLYDDITSKIIAELEAGRVPWVQPWGTAEAKAPLAMPKNAATGRQYSGINVLILWGSVIEHGFPGQSWLTFRQALALGGNVRKGEHGTTVVYADRFVPDDEKKRARETGEQEQAIPFLKRFTVFNAAQCENLPEDVAVAAPPPLPGLIEPKVEALIKATGIDFRIGAIAPFTSRLTTMSWSRRRRPISSRSTGIEPRCMSWGIMPNSGLCRTGCESSRSLVGSRGAMRHKQRISTKAGKVSSGRYCPRAVRADGMLSVFSASNSSYQIGGLEAEFAIRAKSKRPVLRISIR